MEKRIRRFEYIIDKIKDDNILYNLKNINCKYHIIGFQNEILHAFIWFSNAKTTKTIFKLTNSENIKSAETNSMDIYKKIKEMENVWENTKVPKRINYSIHDKYAELANESKENLIKITKILLKDNTMIKKLLFTQSENNNIKMDIISKNNEIITINNEMANKILENQTKLIESNITNNMSNSNILTDNSTDNSKNKKITNINVFLNTECKDAITLKDFINELVIEDEDLMCLKDHGYIESVSRLLNKALVGYDLYKRPIHCSDVKREVMHVKDQEGWKKETPTGESANLDKAFSRLSQLQCKKMVNYYQDMEEPNMDEKASIMCRIAESSNEDNCKKKIIKKIIENIKL
jgi:hypothetical protein